MDKDTVRTLREEIDKALATVAAKHGVSFEMGRIRFTDNDFKGTLRCIDTTETGAISPLELDWNQYLYKYPMLEGLNVGSVVRVGDELHTILGLKPRNRKYPVITKRNHDGRQFKHSEVSIAAAAFGELV